MPKVKISLQNPTGNFWIDNGLVVLYDLLGEGEFDVEYVLNKLIEKLVVETGNKETYFDPQEAKVKDYRKKDWCFPANKFIKSNPSAPKIIIEKSGTKFIGNVDRNYYEIPKIKKFFEKLDANGAVKIDDKKKKICIQFDNPQLLPTDFLKFLTEKAKPKKSVKIILSPPGKRHLNIGQFKDNGICDICGRESVLTEVTMWMFPFAVKQNKFSNFYSGLKRSTKLCPRCALAGLAGYLGWLWKAQWTGTRLDRLHIFIFYSDLKTMLGLRKIFKSLEYKESPKSGNVPLEFSGDYIHETTLGLLFKLFGELRSQESNLSEEAKTLLEEILEESLEEKPLTLFAFSGNPGKAFNMDSMVEFSEFKTLYRLYVRWTEQLNWIEGKPHDVVVGVFRQFQKKEGNSFNSIWRDRIAWAVLELRDPSTFIEDFMFEAKARDENLNPLKFGTLKIFELYWKEVIGMDEKLLNVLRGFGHNLGRTANEKNEMGLLYALRNAKNPDEFYRVLNDIQFRLGLTIPEDILQIQKGEKIKGSPWLRVKTLLSIYAMNSYLSKERKSETQEVES